MIRRNLVRRTAAVLLSSLVVQAGGFPWLVTLARAGDSAPHVVVLPLTGNEAVPEKAPARFRELLVSELKGRDTLSVVNLPDGVVQAAAAPRPSSEPAPEALASLEEGHQQLADLRFDAAAAALGKGIDALTAHPESIDFTRLTDAYIALSVAQFRQGDEDSAQKALLAVARLAPQYRLPDGKFPPIFVREFEKARRRAEKAVKGSISVSGPAGATVYLDGRDLGMLPVLEDNLTAGTHYVKVEGTRGELFGEAVEVKRGVAKVAARFAGAAGGGSAAELAAVGPKVEAAAAGTVAQACRSLGADFAVVGTLYRSGEHQLTISAALYSARHDGFAPLKTFVFDEELLTANVEAFKLADEIADGMDSFPRVASLPLDLAAGATYHVSKIERTREVEVAVTGRRTALTHQDAPPNLLPDDTVAKRQEEEEGRVHALEHTSVAADLSHPAEPADTPAGTVSSGGTAWWVWALVGVGVAGVAGGTYYGVTEATRPVTGTVTARW